MTDRPILFSAPMIRALLDGHKTMTRRLAWGKPKPFNTPDQRKRLAAKGWDCRDDHAYPPSVWQKTRPGDRLWVREAWQDWCPIWDGAWCGCGSDKMRAETHRPAYRATPDERGEPKKWRSSIHMFRWASRLTLIVTATRIERLQDISGDDAIAEGCPMPTQRYGMHPAPVIQFRNLWATLHGPGGWAENPEVVVIGFDSHNVNIDRMETAA